MEFDPVLVHDWLRRSARRMPEKEAIVCGAERWSYKRLDDCSDCLADGLAVLGLGRRDRVVILTGNRPETVVSLYGTLKADGVFVILEGSTKAHRLSCILRNTGAKIVIARADQAAVVRAALAQGDADPRIVWIDASSPPEGNTGTTWAATLARGAAARDATRGAAVGRQTRSIDIDLASLIYTSATVGVPKGVMSTHHNMISAARSVIQYLQNQEDDIILVALPLSFGYGLYQVITAVMFGGTVVLEPSFIYLHRILSRIALERVSGLPLVPTMATMLLRMHDLGNYDLSSLRYLTSAGDVLPVRHIRDLRRCLPHVKIFSMFGLTECKRAAYLDPEELDQRPGSVGKAMPNCEVSVVDEEGNAVGPGETGELIIRGSNVMQGYWEDPEMTARAYRPGSYPAERWLHSGDYFRQDRDGFLYFLGRKDDMIKIRGERVSPREVEDVLCEMDDIAEAAVVGVPDELLGQAIKAFIVPCTRTLDKNTILRYCADRLQPVLIPKYVECVMALPRTPRGKIDKRQLQIGEAR
jgi:long-chain acyl-CoA synthetase